MTRVPVLQNHVIGKFKVDRPLAQNQKTQAMQGDSSQNIPSLARQASIFSLGIAQSATLRLAPRVSRLLRASGVRVKRK